MSLKDLTSFATKEDLKLEIKLIRDDFKLFVVYVLVGITNTLIFSGFLRWFGKI